MRIPTNHKYTLKGPYPSIEKISIAIRKKGHNIRARLKGLAMVYIYIYIYIYVCILMKEGRFRAKKIDGHPSYDHGIKCNTFSLDPLGQL